MTISSSELLDFVPSLLAPLRNRYASRAHCITNPSNTKSNFVRETKIASIGVEEITRQAVGVFTDKGF
jgi:hypothetical protein